MKSKKLTLSAPSGLHARPAGEFVKLIKGYPGTAVTIGNGVRTVNAASMLSLLSLGLKNGSEVEISADGVDEDAVLEKAVAFLSAITD